MSNLVTRIIETPELVRQVQALSPPVLARLVDRVGLEDSGELLALATTEQIAHLFDDILWQSRRPGEDETFDQDRFVVWLTLMLDCGEAALVERLIELDEELVTLAFNKLVLVLDMDALVADMLAAGEDADLVEKALSDALAEEIDRYRIVARTARGWDVVIAALLALDRDHHDTLMRMLERCAAMTSEVIADNGSLYDVLSAAEMLEEDIAGERADRRAAAGHVAPSDARAFLRLAQRGDLPLSERDAITKAYFRAVHTAAASQPSAFTAPVSARDPLVALLRREGVLDEHVAPAPEAPRLPAAPSPGRGAERPAEETLLARALRLLAAEDPSAFVARNEEIAYLANVLAAGAPGPDGAHLRPVDALRQAIAYCNQGLEALVVSQRVAHAGRERAAARLLLATTADALFRASWSRVHAQK